MHWSPTVRILPTPAPPGVLSRCFVKVPETCTNVQRSNSSRPANQCAAVPEVVHGAVSVYAISDLHTDHLANMEWVKDLPTRKGGPCNGATKGAQAEISVLLVAGDVSDDMGLLRTTLEYLVSKFDVVGFVPGNHELWVKGQPGSEAAAARNAGATDSISKLQKVLEVCNELGVLTQPVQIGGLYLVPLLAWHHKSWDKEADIVGIPRASAMTVADYAACIWPEDFPGANELGSAATAAWFDAANESSMQQPGYVRLQQVLQANRNNRRHNGSTNGVEKGMNADVGGMGDPIEQSSQQLGAEQTLPSQQIDVISFSHFLPHQALLPEKRFLSYPNLAKAVGSDFLWSRLQQLQPNLHIFGHSHFAWDMHVEGIRCVQAPLCYPKERRHRVKSIVLQHTPQGHSRGSSTGSSLQQQQHKVQGESRSMGADDEHINSVPWLPVRVYQAKYTAELRAAAGTAEASSVLQTTPLQDNSTGQSFASTAQRWILQQHGLPVVHVSETCLQHHQGQGRDASLLHDSSCRTAAAGQCYVVTEWQSSWSTNLHGVWSEYYKVTAREPHNTELAPWVAKRYQQYPRLSRKLALGQQKQ